MYSSPQGNLRSPLSTGEPTIHPDFPDFLRTVYESRVVPNYTTNGLLLASDTPESEKLLEATREFCGGVAVSFGNKSARLFAKKAIEKLTAKGECKIMIHELIGTKADVDELLELDKEYRDMIHYHVLLPLMAHGRSRDAMDVETYRYLIEKVDGMTNLAFGANFLPFFESNPDLTPNVWEYPRHHYSHNMLLRDGKIQITPSSYDLKVIKEI